jgi:hypothetical protein
MMEPVRFFEQQDREAQKDTVYKRRAERQHKHKYLQLIEKEMLQKQKDGDHAGYKDEPIFIDIAIGRFNDAQYKIYLRAHDGGAYRQDLHHHELGEILGPKLAPPPWSIVPLLDTQGLTGEVPSAETT